ncbi:MAG: hypothetical protein QOI12_1328 [Alphaproteobacteria bacterium]|jgi:predicted small lipoprotein YifL|nr:hypothetical protein [Alphaproteobacteria bacterium]
MLGSIQGVHLVSRSDRVFVRLAAIGALVAALGLAGCGRKAGLDPPPSASVAVPEGTVQPDAGPGLGPDGKAIAPSSAPKKSIFLDWLID